MLIVKFNVAVESQPAAFVPIQVYTPLVVYAVPFHVYDTHSETVVVDVVGDRIVKFNVAVESQPAAFVPIHVYVPLVL